MEVRGNGAANDWRTLSQRRNLFIGACVPARLCLAILAGVCIIYIPRPFAIAIAAGAPFAAAVNLYLTLQPGRRWWAPSTSFVLSVAAFAVAVTYLVAPRYVNLYAIVGLVFASLLAGVLHALAARPWAVAN